MINKQILKQKQYFQTQSILSTDCGVCAINNLIGCEVFSQKDLTKICHSLSDDFINPYKSVFGGDFDVSALIIALKQMSLQIKWIKKGQSILDVMHSPFFKGFLLNTKIKQFKKILNLIGQSGRHWTTLKKQNNQYIYFDSKQQKPTFFNDEEDAENFLQLIRETDAIILAVYAQPQALNSEKKHILQTEIIN